MGLDDYATEPPKETASNPLKVLEFSGVGVKWAIDHVDVDYSLSQWWISKKSTNSANDIQNSEHGCFGVFGDDEIVTNFYSKCSLEFGYLYVLTVKTRVDQPKFLHVEFGTKSETMRAYKNVLPTSTSMPTTSFESTTILTTAQQTTASYKTIGLGKCLNRLGNEPRHTALSPVSKDACRKRCDLDENCFGYSVTKDETCLQWLEEVISVGHLFNGAYCDSKIRIPTRNSFNTIHEHSKCYSARGGEAKHVNYPGLGLEHCRQKCDLDGECFGFSVLSSGDCHNYLEEVYPPISPEHNAGHCVQKEIIRDVVYDEEKAENPGALDVLFGSDEGFMLIRVSFWVALTVLISIVVYIYRKKCANEKIEEVGIGGVQMV